MKIIIIISFMILTSLNSFSQEVRIFTDVLQNVNLSHPLANIGIEIKKGSSSFALSGGYFFNNFMFNENCNGYSFGLEYKLHRESALYYSLGMNYGFLDYKTSNAFLNSDDSSSHQLEIPYTEDYSVKKNKLDFYTKVGYRIESRSFFLDIYGGLGIRVKNVKHFDRTRPQDEFDPVFRVINIRDKEGHMASPILKLGIIIGLKIN